MSDGRSGWKAVESARDDVLFTGLMPLKGYPVTLPESYLSGNQGRGFVYVSSSGESLFGAILNLDFLFVFAPTGDEAQFGEAAAQITAELLDSGEINAIHLLPPLLSGQVIQPGSTAFFTELLRSDFAWREYVRMEFIGNAADYRSDELLQQGFPFSDGEIALPEGTSIAVRSYFGSDLPPVEDKGEAGIHRRSVDLDEIADSEWCRDLVDAIGGIGVFEREGLGVFLYDGDELVCGAASFCRYPNAMEVEVDTRPDRRKAGLARWAGAALSVLAAVHDQYLCWDAAHPSSARIAIDLGLGFSGHYICTAIRHADSSRRSEGGIEH